ncbi:MAG: 1-acyl-sn-glycerol-3-phosphate acyltransferase [Alphaproteobacteria bacterium]|nr:1-acyl-sn-glycerol-3-phosphate acyltransferase [Alphaproteobacteria bacterium]
MIAKTLFLVFVLVPFTVIAIPIQMVIVGLRLPFWQVLPRLFHTLLAQFLGLRITIIGKPYDRLPTLVLSNHVSWLDIPAIGAAAPVAFVAKSDITQWRFVAFMAALQKTILVDRTRKIDTGPTGKRMAAHLARGDAVLLFAEGTSDLGTHILPFRSALVGAIQPAMIQSGAGEMAVQPMTIAYTHLQGMPIGRTERSLIAWVGNMGVGDNFFDILNSGTKSVTIMFGEPIIVTPQTNRKAVTKLAEHKVRAMLVAINRGTKLPPAYNG